MRASDLLHNMCCGFGIQNHTRSLWELIENQYSKKTRHYHNLSHINHCSNMFDWISPENCSREEIQAAILFHDIVYDPKSDSNEADSALIMRVLLELAGVSVNPINRIMKMIIASKDHIKNNNDYSYNTKIFLDVDICSFAGDSFQEECDLIRKEYSFVPSSIFKIKRAEILQAFLDKKYIYRTAPFRERFEEKARKNLAKAIEILQND